MYIIGINTFKPKKVSIETTYVLVLNYHSRTVTFIIASFAVTFNRPHLFHYCSYTEGDGGHVPLKFQIAGNFYFAMQIQSSLWLIIPLWYLLPLVNLVMYVYRYTKHTSVIKCGSFEKMTFVIS